jgi:hypothetical protein
MSTDPTRVRPGSAQPEDAWLAAAVKAIKPYPLFTTPLSPYSGASDGSNPPVEEMFAVMIRLAHQLEGAEMDAAERAMNGAGAAVDHAFEYYTPQLIAAYFWGSRCDCAWRRRCTAPTRKRRVRDERRQHPQPSARRHAHPGQ